MSKYCNNFNLNPADVEIIETALRKVVKSYTTQGMSDRCKEKQSMIRSLNEVLGKLHNQKIFFSQVNNTGVPAG